MTRLFPHHQRPQVREAEDFVQREAGEVRRPVGVAKDGVHGAGHGQRRRVKEGICVSTPWRQFVVSPYGAAWGGACSQQFRSSLDCRILSHHAKGSRRPVILDCYTVQSQ